MNKNEQQQLQNAIKSIKQLEQIVQQLMNKISILERNDIKLKNALIQTTTDVRVLTSDVRAIAAKISGGR